MTNPNTTGAFGLSRERATSFVSRIRSGWVWYDTHLPLVPHARRVERALVGIQRSERATQMLETL